MHTEQTRRN